MAKPVRSSLVYQLTLLSTLWYLPLFLLGQVFVLIFKGQVLPSGIVGAQDAFLIFILCVLELARTHYGKKGNLRERSLPVLVSLALTPPSVGLSVYLLMFQTLVFRLDFILNALLLSLIGGQTLLATMTLLNFYSMP